MGSRLELHSKFVELLGSTNVYYDPPSDLNMQYPAIRYSKSGIKSDHADNIAYSSAKRYEVIVIDRRSDNPVIDELLKLKYSSFDRHYKMNNLNHDVLTIYY